LKTTFVEIASSYSGITGKKFLTTMAIRNLDTLIFGALKGKEENDNNLDFHCARAGNAQFAAGE
jgi:hypothetical protein